METQKGELDNAPIPEDRPETAETPAPLEAEGTAPEETPPGARRRRPILWALAAAVIALAAWYIVVHALPEKTGTAQDPGFLDLREQSITAEEFQQLTQTQPDTEIRWNVPLSSGARDSYSEELTVSALTEEDVELFGFFPNLRKVNAWRCRDYAPLLALRERFPEVDVVWRVELDGRSFRQSSRSVTLSAEADTQDLVENLRWLPELELVRIIGGPMSYADQDALRTAYPGLDFQWDVELCGRIFPCSVTSISFAGEMLTEEELDAIAENAFRFPQLRRLDLTDCGFDRETLYPLAQQLEGVDVIWTMDLYGVMVSTGDREIDLSLRPVRDGAAAIEEALPCFPHLEKVIMTRCGLSNEEMAALNDRHEDVRFVWTVYFSIYSLRTDATNFIAARFVNDAPLYSGECWVLQYCTDLIALDLGHKNLDDLSFLYALPKLQYLILVENDIHDITPIGSLKDLKYLEIFWTKVEDLSPLIQCTNLLDLNICYIYSRRDKAFDVLMQMPWLERLWYCGNALTPEQVEALRENMPQCEMYLEPHGESTGGTWREHPRYFEMRDVFEMYYMKGGTNGVDESCQQVYYTG